MLTHAPTKYTNAACHMTNKNKPREIFTRLSGIYTPFGFLDCLGGKEVTKKVINLSQKQEGMNFSQKHLSFR